MSTLRNQLEESHKDLHQWFLFHQECLLLDQMDYAKQSFDAFADYLSEHIHFENTHVLIESEAFKELRWPLVVYRKEHEKLVSMLARLSSMLDDYYQMSGRRKRLALLELLAYEQSLHHVMEHHEEREEMDLFNLIDEQGVQWRDVDDRLKGKYSVLKDELKAYLAQA